MNSDSEVIHSCLSKLREMDSPYAAVSIEELLNLTKAEATLSKYRDKQLRCLLNALNDYWKEQDPQPPRPNLGDKLKELNADSFSLRKETSKYPNPPDEERPSGADQSVTQQIINSNALQSPELQPTKPYTPTILTKRATLHLMNARVGEAYEYAFSADDIKNLRLLSDTGSGLYWDETAGVLQGMPVKAGEFQLKFETIGGQRTELLANLVVIPDPKTLWTNTPSNRDGLYWKPDEASLSLRRDLFCVGVSKRGRSHARAGGFRDDDFMLLNSGGWYVAAVADGAGSAIYSRRGSKIAVDTIAKVLPSFLTEKVDPSLNSLLTSHKNGDLSASREIKDKLYKALAQAAFAGAQALETEAGAIGAENSAFYTTLIIAACKKTSSGWFFACFSIGDGGAAVYSERTNNVVPLTKADGGEFAGQTRFLQSAEFADSSDVHKRVSFVELPEFSVFAIMTDGITDPKFPTEADFVSSEKWAEFWEGDLKEHLIVSDDLHETEKRLLNWLDFWSPGNHDDRTIIVLVPSGEIAA
jgi:serine/threonine protein phosphatase PrpC